MLVRLVFVPLGGGEADYSMDFEVPAIPRAGDYIVRRTWWSLQYPDTEGFTAKEGEHGEFRQAAIECEFAIGPFSSEDHKNACHRYQQKTGQLREFDDSMY